MPPRRAISIWFGGHAEVTLRRVVEWGDGWVPMDYAPGDEAKPAFAKLRARAEAAGRDTSTVAASTHGSPPGSVPTPSGATPSASVKSCGVSHLTLATYSGRGHLRRIAGRTLADHLAAVRRYWDAVADLL